ncbi:uncharacterized protein LOC112519530 [Cynara cardunculus var. scolymus]|uniref:Alpha/beta hydrolase fold-1 n=1 Tax=Cynara cardunculus var. scolymus TaxID=59895 RepID=A0A118K0R7_CYNCS|nr:uncharacterized protein LOC112519530 [Cynara cardunculus var. scolymus]KVI01036.1 Alpha/beta hydrolase fold-1 [Cynara cardunculus var. scolymus]
MDKVLHKSVQVDGLKLHVAEVGSESSPAVIFLHGFPEIWYTWRYQMIAVANAGFRAIAPDFRGYGLSDSPAEPEKASFADFVNDIVSILDSLGISKVFVVAKDFGAMVAFSFVLLHPEKVAGLISLGMIFVPPGAYKRSFALPEGFYVRRWQEPGRAEADFGRLDVKTVVRNIYILFSKSEIPIADENQEIMDLVKPTSPLPSWFTEEDLATYGALYERSGFRTALQVPYRATYLDVGPVEHDPKMEAPTLLIMGEEDYVMKIMDEYVRSDGMKKYVPNLETIYVPHGSHFVHEQFPDHVNQLIVTFLDRNKHRVPV